MSFSIPFTNVPLLHRITLLIRSTSRHSFLLPLLGSFGESRALCVRAKGALTYNALGQIMTVDGGASSYYYNGSDERTFKQTGSNWTSYIYLNGQPMAEQSSSGIWTDYIYANGQKIAKVVSQLPVLDLHGVRNSSDYQCGLQGALSGMSSGAAGTVIATGDRLVVDMQQNVATDGGVALIFTNGAGTGSLVDSTSGQGFFSNGFTDGLWHHMAGSLASYVGLTVSYALAGIHQTAAFSTFDLYIANLAIVHANGSITPIGVASTGTTVAGFTGSNCAGSGFSAGMVTTPVTDPTMATNYYVDDHLGTAQMETDGAGWPIWEAQFTPFGLELDTSYTPMHYKFTGKERDTESGLDYFGARYNSSSMGRFMSPDYSDDDDGPVSIPFYNPSNPQSMNLYSYVRNNPISHTDPDGHDCVVQSRTSSTSESVSVSTGNCDNVQVGDGQTKTYVAGTVTGVQAGADGHSIDIGYTAYGANGDTSSSVTNAGAAPIPGNTNLAYNWGNNAQGYQQLAGAANVVNKATVIAVGAYGAAFLGPMAYTALAGGSEAEAVGLTEHGAARLAERGISPEQAKAAIEAAKKAGDVVEGMGRYGPQLRYTANGIKVIVATTGANAGKIITAIWK